jgi:hypothetical protein
MRLKQTHYKQTGVIAVVGPQPLQSNTLTTIGSLEDVGQTTYPVGATSHVITQINTGDEQRARELSSRSNHSYHRVDGFTATRVTGIRDVEPLKRLQLASACAEQRETHRLYQVCRLTNILH